MITRSYYLLFGLLCYFQQASTLHAQCNTGIVANFSFTGANSCANLPINFTNNSTGTGLSFEWNFGNPSSGASNTSTQNNPSHIFISPGSGTATFQVELIATASNGCKDTVVQSISVQQSPGASLEDPINEFKNCDGTQYNILLFDLTPSSGNTQYKIIWGDGSPDFIEPTFPGGGATHTYATDQIYNLTYIVSGANGCIDSNLYTVANITNPSVGAANPGGTTGCGPLEICFPLNNFSGNHSSTTYTIDYGDGTSIDTIAHPPPNELCHMYDKTSCGTGSSNAYTFKISAINFCDISEATITPIKIYLKPEAEFTAPENACLNSPVNFINNTIAGFFGGSCSQFTQCEWDFGDGTIINTNDISNQSHTYTATGTYTVSLSATNNCGTSIFTKTICIESIPVPDFTLNVDTACVPVQVNTKNLSNSGDICLLTFDWGITTQSIPCATSGASPNFINGSDATSFEPQIEFLDPGTYQVVLSATNSCGVFNKSIPVVAQGPPEVTINNLADICLGQTVTPTAFYSTCLAPIENYSWSFQQGSPSTSSLETPDTINYVSSGTFNITLTVENSCGTNNSSISIHVLDAPTGLNPSISAPPCAGTDVQLSVDSIAGASYTWTGPNGFSSTLQNPLLTGVNSSQEGTYSVSASFGSCPGPSETVLLTLIPTDTVDAGDNFSLCLDAAQQNLVPLTATGGTWSGNGISTGGNFDPSVAGVGTHILSYTFTDPNSNCTVTDDRIAQVHALPTVDAGSDLNLCNQAIAVPLSGSPSGGTWSGNGVTNPNGEFTPSSTGSFEVIYTFSDINGCSNQDTILVNIINASSVSAGQDTSVCENQGPIQLTGNPSSGTWSGDGVSTSGSFSPNAVGTVELIYLLGSGSCLSTDTLLVEVLAKPDVQAGPDFDICLNAGNGSLSGSPSGGLWSGTGITDALGTYDASIAGIGSHILTYTYEDPITQCSNSSTLTMTVISSPVINIGLDTSICNQPFPVQLNASPSGGTWTGPQVDPTGLFTPNSSGIFTLTYTLSATPPCAAFAEKTITVVDPSQAEAGSDQNLCFSNQTNQLSGLPLGGTWSGPLVNPNGTMTPNLSGTYKLFYSFGSGNCFTQDSLQLIIFDLPILDVPLDQAFCSYDAPVNLQGIPAGGTWTGEGISDPLLGTFDPGTVINVDSDIYAVYTYSDPATSCENKDSLIIQVNRLPEANFNFNPISCTNQLENFNNTSTNAATFEWDFGDASPVLTEMNPQHSYTTPGNYSVQLVAISNAACRDSLSQTIEIRESPMADYQLTVDNGCGPLDVLLTNLSSGVGAISYFWDFGNGMTSSDEQPGTVTFNSGVLSDTSYVIRLDVGNLCGTVTRRDTVVVKSSPTAVFGTLFDEGCTPYEAEIAQNSYGLPDQFQWDFGDGTSSNTSEALFTHTFITGDEDTVYQIRLIVSNACGSDTVFHDIHILPKSVHSFFNTDQLSGCAPLTVNYTNFSTGAAVNNWDLGNGNTTTDQHTSTVYNDPGSYTVRLIVNDNCSIDTSFATITVHPRPTIDFSFSPDAVCAGQFIHFQDLSVDISQLLWDFGDGITSTLNNPSHNYDQGGSFDVVLSGFSTLYQCETAVIKNVTVNNAPQADFDIPSIDACVPANYTFNNTSQNFSFSSWNFGDGNISGSNQGNHTYSSAGNYTVTLIVENTAFCRDTITKNVQIFPVPQADFVVTLLDSCTLPAQLEATNQSFGANSYQWTFGNGEQSNLTNGSASYLNPGVYPLKLVASNSYQCKDSISKPVQIFQAPQASMLVSSTELCQNQNLILTATSLSADSNVWFLGDGNILLGNQVIHQFSDVGTYDVSIIAYGQGACSDTFNFAQQITVKETPIADFDFTNIETDGKTDGTIQFMNLSQQAHLYIWEIDEAFLSDEINPQYKYDFFGEAIVKLTAINNNGCRDTLIAPIVIELFKGLHVANAMYPGHSVFEVANFVPKGVGLSSYHIGIYDDWGNLIWESSELDGNGRPTGYWNGTFKGEPVQQDAYVWKVEATYKNDGVWEGKKYPNGKIKRSGTVTLIR